MPDNTSLTPVERQRLALLVVTSREGEVVAVFGGWHRSVPDFLQEATMTMEEDGLPPVRKQTPLNPLCLDCYQVDRDFVLGMVSLRYPAESWELVKQTISGMPQTAVYTFVISY